MNSNLIQSRSTAWLVAMALGAGSLSACAQAAGPTGVQPATAAQSQNRADERHERMQAWQARRLQNLKARLQLTPAQENAWASYAAALQALPSHPDRQAQRDEWMRLSTPERLDRMKAVRAQHQAEMNAFMDRRSEATKTFYSALTPEQKKTFDAETALLMEGHGSRGGEGHRHGGPGSHHGMMPGSQS